jgi:hypothetical protein
MRGGDLVGLALSEQSGKPSVTQLAGCRLQAGLLFPRAGRGMSSANMQLQSKSLAQFAHEILVGVGFGATNPVMKVGDGEHHTQLLTQLQQCPQQSYRIRPSGDSHGHPVSGLEQVVA